MPACKKACSKLLTRTLKPSTKSLPSLICLRRQRKLQSCPSGSDATAPQGSDQHLMGMMEDILAALQTTQKAVGKSNTNAASDLGVVLSILRLACASLACRPHQPVRCHDEAFVADYRSKGEEPLQKGCALADEIYQEIESCLIDKRKEKSLSFPVNGSPSRGNNMFYQILELRIRFNEAHQRGGRKARHC